MTVTFMLSTSQTDTASRGRYCTEQKAASYLDVKVSTLRDWRFRGSGPPFSKLGRLVRYDLSALDEWMRSRMNPKRGRDRN